MDDLKKGLILVLNTILIFIYSTILLVFLLMNITKESINNNIITDITNYFVNKATIIKISGKDVTEKFGNYLTDSINSELEIDNKKSYTKKEINILSIQSYKYMWGIEEFEDSDNIIKSVYKKTITNKEKYNENKYQNIKKEYINKLDNKTDKKLKDRIKYILYGNFINIIKIVLISIIVILIIINIKNLKIIKMISISTILVGSSLVLIGELLSIFQNELEFITKIIIITKDIGIKTSIIGIIGLIIYFVIKYITEEKRDNYA